MRRLTATIIIAIFVTGCARQHGPRAGSGVAAPATAPFNPNAERSFESVAIDLVPPIEPATTTRPTTLPTLEALELYARARDALFRRDDFSAVDLLERALKADPDSPELYYALGRAYLQRGGSTERAAELLRRATELDPDSLDAWLDLARLYLRNAPSKAMRPLIGATRTADFESRDPEAAIVDFHLARLLQQDGYDRAACERYESLLLRLQRRAVTRGYPEVASLAAHPEPVQMELARLYEKRGMYDRAIELYERLDVTAPNAFEPHARVVRAYLASGRTEQAIGEAADVVRQFRASPASIELLLEAYRGAGDESRAIAELSRLHKKDPEDRALLTGLADALTRLGKGADAQKLLADALRQKPADLDLLRRLISTTGDDTRAAARLLMEQSARRPEGTVELSSFWRPLLRSWRPGALKSEDLKDLSLPREAQSARLYWMSQLAAESRRTSYARTLMKQATEAQPVFPPALVARVQQIWSVQGGDNQAKQVDADAVVAIAKKSGGPTLAGQIAAVSAFYSKQTPEDLPAFDAALASGAQFTPEISTIYAQSLLRASKTADYERVMWKLLSDYPGFEQAYLELFRYYDSTRQAGPAIKVLESWLRADPRSVAARLAYANILLASRQLPAADASLTELLREAPDDDQVLLMYTQAAEMGERRQQAVDELEKIRTADPHNGAAIAALVGWHVNHGDTPAALRVMESATESAAGQANLLYFLASIYNTEMNEQEQGEKILEKAIAADPKHVPASNDLAYFWSDQGRNLPQAEQMARRAVAAEPDNSAYLDTLGWVLYKQNHLAEAKKFLQQAVDSAAPVDPVLLDHLADTHYRLGEEQDAVALWLRANEMMQRTNADQPERIQLKSRLVLKLRQKNTGEPVEAAPLAANVNASR